MSTTTTAARNTITAEGCTYTVTGVAGNLSAWDTDNLRDAMQARGGAEVRDAEACAHYDGAVAAALGLDADDVCFRAALEGHYIADVTVTTPDGAEVPVQAAYRNRFFTVDPVDADDLDAVPADATRVLEDWLGTAMQRAWEAAIAG